uniref:HMG box domain-containing protein n=1 Tax=Rhizochromulina marina TaxID=1034831 RepID=A0A7S2RFQ1_9STRA
MFSLAPVTVAGASLSALHSAPDPAVLPPGLAVVGPVDSVAKGPPALAGLGSSLGFPGGSSALAQNLALTMPVDTPLLAPSAPSAPPPPPPLFPLLARAGAAPVASSLPTAAGTPASPRVPVSSISRLAPSTGGPMGSGLHTTPELFELLTSGAMSLRTSQALPHLESLQQSCWKPTVSMVPLHDAVDSSLASLSTVAVLASVPPDPRPRNAGEHPHILSPGVFPSPTEGQKGDKKKRRRAMKKAPQAPKRSKTAYIMYSMNVRDEVKRELGDQAPVTSVITRIAEKWRQLSDHDRRPWQAQAELDRTRYKEELQNYDGPLKVPNRRKKKTPDMPKRAMSAFLEYAKIMRPKLKLKYPDQKNTEISKMLGTTWKNMEEEEKQPFKARAAAEGERYHEQMREYRAGTFSHHAEEENKPEEEVPGLNSEPLEEDIPATMVPRSGPVPFNSMAPPETDSLDAAAHELGLSSEAVGPLGHSRGI